MYYDVHECDMSVNIPESLQGVTLWRYMSLEKFLAVIQSRSLHFSRLSEFRDKYEGRCPIAWQGPITDLSQLPDLARARESADAWRQVGVSIPEGKYLKDDKLPDEVYVSCWHKAEQESAAMWSLYSRNSGIAIKTISDQLGNSLRSCERNIELAAVEYIDMTSELMSSRPWTIKRPSFQHEREVRAAIRDPGCQTPGLLVSVDIEVLIDDIHISPESEPWIEDVVKDVVAKYGLHKKVKRSQLYELL